MCVQTRNISEKFPAKISNIWKRAILTISYTFRITGSARWFMLVDKISLSLPVSLGARHGKFKDNEFVNIVQLSLCLRNMAGLELFSSINETETD